MHGRKKRSPSTLHKINLYYIKHTCAFSVIKAAIKEESTKPMRIKYSQSQAEYVHIGKYQTQS